MRCPLLATIRVRLVALPILSHPWLYMLLRIAGVLPGDVLVGRWKQAAICCFCYCLSSGGLTCVGWECIRLRFVHDLILSRGAPSLVPHRGAIPGVGSGQWAEVANRWARVDGDAQVEGAETRIPLKEAVDFRLQALRGRGRGGGQQRWVCCQLHISVESLDQG